MRGQVVRGSQADNPGDMPLQLRRLAERQACVFQRLRPREQGFAAADFYTQTKTSYSAS